MANSLQRMRNARYNQLRQNVQNLAIMVGHRDAPDLTDKEMQYLRSSVEEISQQFHEFNALRNAMNAFGNVKGT